MLWGPGTRNVHQGKAVLNSGSCKYSGACVVVSHHSGGALWEGLKDMMKHCNMQRTRPVQRRCWKGLCPLCLIPSMRNLHISPCFFLGQQHVGNGCYRLMLLCAVFCCRCYMDGTTG